MATRMSETEVRATHPRCIGVHVRMPSQMIEERHLGQNRFASETGTLVNGEHDLRHARGSIGADTMV